MHLDFLVACQEGMAVRVSYYLALLLMPRLSFPFVDLKLHIPNTVLIF